MPTTQAETAAAEPVIALREVTVSFNGLPVLEDLSFTVAPGETRILLGPAGVGKSVLLKVVNGLVRPERGSVRLFGEELTAMPEERLFALRARTGMVFQEGALFDSLSVRDNVAYQLIQDGMIADEEIDARVREALHFVGLEETFAMFPASLSGGMRRRVAIARALIHHPQLVLYDSPTGGLDPVTSNHIMELVMRERDAHQTPSLLVTHRLQDAFLLCSSRFDEERNRVVALPRGETVANTSFLMLAEGRLIFDGSIEELMKSENTFVREFLE